jgi:hypothetical protein
MRVLSGSLPGRQTPNLDKHHTARLLITHLHLGILPDKVHMIVLSRQLQEPFCRDTSTSQERAIVTILCGLTDWNMDGVRPERLRSRSSSRSIDLQRPPAAVIVYRDFYFMHLKIWGRLMPNGRKWRLAVGHRRCQIK